MQEPVEPRRSLGHAQVKEFIWGGALCEVGRSRQVVKQGGNHGALVQEGLWAGRAREPAEIVRMMSRLD